MKTFLLILFLIINIVGAIQLTQAPVTATYTILKREDDAEKSASKASVSSVKSVSKASVSALNAQSSASKASVKAASRMLVSESKSSVSSIKSVSKESVSHLKAISSASKASVIAASRLLVSESKASASDAKRSSKAWASANKISSSMSKQITKTISGTVETGVLENLEDGDTYVDIYGCDWSTSVTTVDDISNAKYGCRNQAWVSYYLYQGNLALENLTYIINENSTFVKNYEAYIDMIQKSIMSEFGVWLMQKGGSSFYACAGKKYLTQCMTQQLTGKEAMCLGGSMSNLYLPNASAIDGAVQSLQSYYKLTGLTKDDIDVVHSDAEFYLSKNENVFACKYTARNCSFISAVDLAPNPVANLTYDNLQDLANVLATADQAKAKANPLDLLDLLVAVPNFIDMGQTAMTIDTTGAEDRKIEAEERKLMILNIIFTFVGIASFALNGAMAIVLDVALAAIQTLATWSITGSLDATTIVMSVVGVAGGVFDLVKASRSLNQVVQFVRSSRDTGFSEQLLSFPAYRDVVGKVYGVNLKAGKLS